jgi:hypothetical protein
MMTFLRVAGMLSVLAAASWGATIQITGTLESASGAYSLLLAPGTQFTGTVEITGSGADSTSDDPNEIGTYSISVGRIDLNIGNLIFLTFNADESDQFSLTTFENSTSNDTLDIYSNVPGTGSATITLLGNDSFVAAPAAADGSAALAGINWAAFISGVMTVSVPDQVQPTGEIVMPAADGFDSTATFAIDSVGEVPEPGTVFAVAAGGLVLWLKRRQSR